MITDSHCHLGSGRYDDGEIAEIIQIALNAGVQRMITLSTSLEDIPKNLKLANHPQVRAAIGIHPCDVHHAPDNALQLIRDFFPDPRVVAIGETGLDYYHPAPEGWSQEDYRKRQNDFLNQHFQLAQEMGLNVVIHTRDLVANTSFEDALKIYAHYSHHVRAVFHCFVSPWSFAERVLKLGGFISFGGVVTFKNAQLVKDAALKCPAGRFMIETDSPYLTPDPFRGKRNEPAYAMRVAEYIAQLRGETLAELSNHTEDACFEFFR